MNLEERIDALYGLPLERFIAERDALGKELRAAGDAAGAATAKALRKPVASAWALNVLARQDQAGVRELLDLGGRMREAHRRAISGGDAEPLRIATEHRRALVSKLSGKARAILEREGGAGTNVDQIASTLEAASVDAEAAELLRSGRLIKPLKPPAAMPEASLRVVEGGRGDMKASARMRGEAAQVSALQRELRSAEARQRRATEAVAREHARMEDLERRRAEGRERLHAAQAELRGASLETRRIAARLQKLRPGR